MEKWPGLSKISKIWRVSLVGFVSLFVTSTGSTAVVGVVGIDPETQKIQVGYKGQGASNFAKEDQKVAGTDFKPRPVYGLGDTLQTDYFNIKVVSIRTVKRKLYAFGKSPGRGNVFLVLRLEIENKDTEARTLLTLGKLFATLNGKVYEFDSFETVLKKGYFLVWDELNPLVKSIGYVAFKISDKFAVKNIRYNPPRSEEFIHLKNIKLVETVW